MTSDDQAIRIAADSIQKLRKVDVYRVLDTCSEPDSVAAYIIANRPELSAEVSACPADLKSA